jgi:hypothetical protein
VAAVKTGFEGLILESFVVADAYLISGFLRLLKTKNQAECSFNSKAISTDYYTFGKEEVLTPWITLVITGKKNAITSTQRLPRENLCCTT